MALFTDGSIATLEDLRAWESNILDLAGTEGIDLGAKLAVAQRELGLEIASFLSRRAAQAGLDRQMDNVVVTEPLLQAHVHATIALIYRDACNRQLNDRFQVRWKSYEEFARQARLRLFDIGIGLANVPVGKPEPPVVKGVSGGVRPAASWLVRTAAVNWQGYSGALSDPVAVDLRPGQLAEVNPGLLPPGGTGWLIYIGETDDRLWRQTPTPRPPESVWTSPVDGLRQDLLPVAVQLPDYFIANRREILRG